MQKVQYKFVKDISRTLPESLEAYYCFDIPNEELHVQQIRKAVPEGQF
jgi:hypothetical protein